MLKKGDVVRWVGPTDRRRKHKLFIVAGVYLPGTGVRMINLLKMDGKPYILKDKDHYWMQSSFPVIHLKKDEFLTAVHKRRKAK